MVVGGCWIFWGGCIWFLVVLGGFRSFHVLVTTIVHQLGPPIWRLHTKLYKGAWNVSATNSETVGHKDLRFGQIVYIVVVYNISYSWLLPPDGFKCIFLCSVYCVTVKTKNTRSDYNLPSFYNAAISTGLLYESSCTRSVVSLFALTIFA